MALLRSPVDLLREALAVKRLNHAHLIYYIFNFIGLQPSNQINLESRVKMGLLGQHFLHPVFSKAHKPFLQNLIDGRRIHVFADRDDLRRSAPALKRRGVKLCSDICNALMQAVCLLIHAEPH